MTYGTGTRSYNRSSEKRRSDEERAAATKKFESGPRVEIDVPTGCPCCHRVACVWGSGPVWSTSPDWVKHRALDSDHVFAAEAAVKERERRDSGIRKAKVAFVGGEAC